MGVKNPLQHHYFSGCRRNLRFHLGNSRNHCFVRINLIVLQVSSNTGPSVLHSIPFPTGPPNCQSCTTPNQHSRATEPSCKTRSERGWQKKSHCGSLQLQSSPCPCPHTSAATRGVVTGSPSHLSACSVEMRPAVPSAWSPSRTQPRLLRPHWKTREGQQDGAAGLWSLRRQPE